jgi:myo-inositol catabolism protein IolC
MPEYQPRNLVEDAQRLKAERDEAATRAAEAAVMEALPVLIEGLADGADQVKKIIKETTAKVDAVGMEVDSLNDSWWKRQKLKWKAKNAWDKAQDGIKKG